MRKKYLIIILLTFIICSTVYSKSGTNIKYYLNTGTPIDSNAKDIMPTLDDLPKYQNIACKYTHKSIIVFESNSVALVVKYDDKTYKSEKDKLAKKYTFLDQKIPFNGSKSEYIIPEYEFSINSYTFKVVAGNVNGKGSTRFPKSFGMIGTSEKKKSIAYLYFYDTDLDLIGGGEDKNPMAHFVNHYFNYDF